MKITSKVLHRWHSQHKYEESMVQSVYNKDYIINMYQILGNSQGPNQFTKKYYGVFTFMLNRYLKQALGQEMVTKLKKIILTVKKESNMYIMIDLSEEELVKDNSYCASPIQDFKPLQDHSNIFISSKPYFNDLTTVDLSSPVSGSITPVHNKIFIEENDYSH